VFRFVTFNWFVVQLVWRPRPPTLLSKDQIKEIKKNLKKYSDQFNAKDKMRLSRASKELVSLLF
jgi:translation initiation factor 3 subunit B